MILSCYKAILFCRTMGEQRMETDETDDFSTLCRSLIRFIRYQICCQQDSMLRMKCPYFAVVSSDQPLAYTV